MAPIMRGLEAEAYDREYSDRELLRRIARYFSRHWRSLVIISVIVVVMYCIGAS
jgi:hypothetical protein